MLNKQKRILSVDSTKKSAHFRVYNVSGDALL